MILFLSTRMYECQADLLDKNNWFDRVGIQLFHPKLF